VRAVYRQSTISANYPVTYFVDSMVEYLGVASRKRIPSATNTGGYELVLGLEKWENTHENPHPVGQAT
jgi:hypothetical protein